MKTEEEKNLEITILGSGTCVPSLRRSSCALLMKAGDFNFLFDCGAGTMGRLLETGMNIHAIDAIFLSHFHPDHTGELASFLFATKYPNPGQRRKPLKIVAGKGISRFYKGLKQAYGEWIALASNLMQIVELDTSDPDRRIFGPVIVDTAPMAHNPESLGYRVTARGGASAVYSGDTDYTEALIALARHADLLVCESALPDGMNVSGHLTPSLAGKIATRAKVSELVLTHFYPECENADIVSECQKSYSGRLRLAEDLMKIRVVRG
jgi:ribonuclease BN (tRNA processing enzyme)